MCWVELNKVDAKNAHGQCTHQEEEEEYAASDGNPDEVQKHASDSGHGEDAHHGDSLLAAARQREDEIGGAG